MSETEIPSPAAPPPPVFTAPGVVLVLIGALIGVHLALWLAGEDWQVWALYAFAFIPVRLGGGEAIPMIPGSQLWSFLTYALLHAGAAHLLFNSLWLLIFGTVVARYLGAWRFLLLCAVAAAGGAVATLALHWGEGVIVIGASAAVSGLLAAAVPIMYGRRMRWGEALAGDPSHAVPLSPSGLFRHRGALIFMAVFVAITLFSGATGFAGNSFLSEGGIAWEAHLGVFVTGLGAFYLLARRGPSRI
jgi:membrane associated rhomboid family serine protease